MHGRLQIALVADVDDELRPFAHAERRAGDGAVVGEHADSRAADALRHRRDPQLERVAVAELDELGLGCLCQARRIRLEMVLVVPVVMFVVLHRQTPSAAPAACGARLSLVSGAASPPPSSWPAMNPASSATKPSRAEPRVCCHDSPRK